MISLGPEARATAQSVFGPRLEQLESVEQLSDFIDVFEVLGESMGVEFSLLNEDDDDDETNDVDDGIIDSLFSKMPQQRSDRNRSRSKAASSSGLRSPPNSSGSR